MARRTASPAKSPFVKNDQCDNRWCESANGQVRLLPLPGGANAILCFHCFAYEMRARTRANKDLAGDCRWDIPAWDSLEIYESFLLI